MPWFGNLNICDIAIKDVDYHCNIHDISKSEAINLLEHSVLEDGAYIQDILSDFWLGVVDLTNANHLKKDTWRINTSSVAP